MIQPDRVLRVVCGLVLLMTVAAGVQMACTPSPATAAAVDVPPGLAKGTIFWLIFRTSGAVAEKFEVQEVHGAWVRATVVRAVVWDKGREVWINLAAVDQIGFVPGATAQRP